MKFKMDENMPIEAAALLREADYDVKTVTEQNMRGSSDSDVISVCQEESRILITLDTDFTDIRKYPPEQTSGLIVLRLKRQDKPYVLKIFSRFVKMIPHEPIEHRLWIIEEDRIRIREKV